MKVLSTRLRGLLAASVMLVPLTASATNGYFLIGYGSKTRGMGGVGTAYGVDGLAAASNPATMADVKLNGVMRVDLGAELFNPPRSVVHSSDTLGNTDEKSGSNLFLIPSMGMVYKFNRKMTIGFAFIGNGANTRYNQQVPGKPGCLNGQTDANGNPDTGVGSYFFNFNCNADSYTVGVNLLQGQMLPGVAYRLNKHHTVGASLALGVQSFRAYGLGAFSDLGFAGPGATKTSGNGNDWSYGAGIRVGWMGKFLKNRLTLGANYASRVYMTRFRKYETLFAEQGSFDIPEHYSVGLAVKVTPKLTVAADYQRINYSGIRSVSNPGPNAYNSSDLNPLCPGVDTPDCLLGGDNGMGFGWTSIDVYKIGFNYEYNSRWSVRAGFDYNNGAIQDDQVLFNMLAPATVKKHATVGLSYRPNRNMEWSVNYMHAFEETISGPTAYTNRPIGEDNASISMYINSIGIGFAYMM